MMSDTPPPELPFRTTSSQENIGNPSFGSGRERDGTLSRLSILNGHYDHRIRPLIGLIDRLRDIGLDEDVGLPAIVVVGDQSVGKTSVLEAISGIQLPRGTGTVTRCPLELRLKKNDEKWTGSIQYKPASGSKEELTINRPEDVEKFVRNAQDVLAGKDISTDLITLDIEGPELPDLTLIDLPGIVRIRCDDQEEDISSKIKQMIRDHIRKPETIILAVIPANVDIETSEALHMAREVDPDRIRTIGVLTKIDMVDRGAEDSLLNVLRNKRYELKKGYIAVKCRGQQAINDKQSLEEALEKEQEFFQNFKHFRSISEDVCGIDSLCSRLTDELVEQVQKVLPGLRNQIFAKKNETYHELRDLGDGIPSDETQKHGLLVKNLTTYLKDLQTLSDGEEVDVNIDLGMSTHNTFRECFTQFTQALIECEKNYPDEIEVLEILKKYRGRDLPGFVKFKTFTEIARLLIKKFHAPAELCLANATEAMFTTLRNIVAKRFQRFPPLKGKVEHITTQALNSVTQEADVALTELFKMEAMIFAHDQKYKEKLGETDDGYSNELLKSDDGDSTEPAESDYGDAAEPEQRFVCRALDTYMRIAVDRICDYVPMVITLHMLSKLGEELKKKLIDLTNPSSGSLDLLREEESIQKRRNILERKLGRLEKADNEIREF